MGRAQIIIINITSSTTDNIIHDDPVGIGRYVSFTIGRYKIALALICTTLWCFMGDSYTTVTYVWLRPNLLRCCAQSAWIRQLLSPWHNFGLFECNITVHWCVAWSLYLFTHNVSLLNRMDGIFMWLLGREVHSRTACIIGHRCTHAYGWIFLDYQMQTDKPA